MKHYNPSLGAQTQRILNLKGESIEEIREEIIPVVVLNNVCNAAGYGTVTNSGAATTVYAVGDKDFYLTHAELGWYKDAGANATNCEFKVTINGVAHRILRIAHFTATADNRQLVQTFNPPIKVDRNTNITINMDAGGANTTIFGIAAGYTVETTASTL